VSVETPETGQTDDLIFGVNGTRNATGMVLCEAARRAQCVNNVKP
jgi:hypothetical protein